MWTWDERKAKANLAKHGVSFAAAILAIEEVFALQERDPHPDGDRWSTLGFAGQTLLHVTHTWIGLDSGRIISARRATPAERRRYEDER